MAVGQLTEKVEVTAASPLLETDSSQRGQVITGDQTRALPLNGREYSSLALLTTGVKLAGSALTTGNTPREGRVQRQRPAQHVQQLPDRRRRQQRLRHQQPGLLEPGDAAAARRGRRVQGRHQQHERRVRPRRRRDHQRRLPQRHQPVPRRRLGVLPRHGAERDRLLQAGRRAEAAARPQPVRRRARRADREEQGVLLRRLRGVPPDAQGRPAFSTHCRRRRSARASCRSTSAIRAPAPSIRPARRFR